MTVAEAPRNLPLVIGDAVGVERVSVVIFDIVPAVIIYQQQRRRCARLTSCDSKGCRRLGGDRNHVPGSPDCGRRHLHLKTHVL